MEVASTRKAALGAFLSYARTNKDEDSDPGILMKWWSISFQPILQMMPSIKIAVVKKKKFPGRQYKLGRLTALNWRQAPLTKAVPQPKLLSALWCATWCCGQLSTSVPGPGCHSERVQPSQARGPGGPSPGQRGAGHALPPQRASCNETSSQGSRPHQYTLSFLWSPMMTAFGDCFGLGVFLQFLPPIPPYPQRAMHRIMFHRRQMESEMYVSNPAYLITWILKYFIWINLLNQLSAYTSLGNCHEREQQRLWWWTTAAKSFSSPLPSSKILKNVHLFLSQETHSVFCIAFPNWIADYMLQQHTKTAPKGNISGGGRAFY